MSAATARGSTGRRLQPDQRREQIVVEAISFFSEYGIDATTRELSERLRVTESLLYRYFATKQQLLDVVYDRVFLGRLKPHWPKYVVDTKVPLQERMTKFYIEYYDAVMTREWVRLFVFAGLQGDNLNRRYIDQLERTIIAPLHAEIIAQARSKKGDKAKQPTMDDMWMLHGSIFYLGIREHVYGLSNASNRNRAIIDGVARLLKDYGV